MQHEIHTIKSIRITAPYTLQIIFGDNSHKIINFLPVLKGEMFGPLKNTEYFKRVMLDAEVKTIVWPNGADFDPSILYNWEQHIEELRQRAETWDTQNI